MELRIALAITVVLGSSMVGRSLSGTARRRASTLKDLTDGMRNLRVHMLGMLESTEIALSGNGSGLLRAVGTRMTGGVSASEAWQAVAPELRRRGGAADCLEEEDMRLLDRFFAGLGVSGREEQRLLFEGAIQEMEERVGVARDRSAQADRLYLTLSALIGIMLALIVI